MNIGIGFLWTVEMGDVVVRIEDSSIGNLLVTMSSARDVVFDLIGY